ncbi:MAG: hypothetical protein O0X49_08345 [Methanocorpusculum sp.]|nr:hypothetical protein [Methanocorpusculum sp.]
MTATVRADARYPEMVGYPFSCVDGNGVAAGKSSLRSGTSEADR